MMSVLVLVATGFITSIACGDLAISLSTMTQLAPIFAVQSADDTEVVPARELPRPPEAQVLKVRRVLPPPEADPETPAEEPIPPTPVKISMRAIEIDNSKLDELQLRNPLQAYDDSGKRKPHATMLISDLKDRELQKQLQELVEKDCAKYVTDSVVTTTMGRSATLNCYREPVPKNAVVQNPDAIGAVLPARTVGFGIKAYPRPAENGRIRLEVTGRVTSEDQQNAVRLNGQFVPGISSRGFRTTIEIDSGKTFVMEGVKTTRDFYWLVSVEVLPEPKGE